MPQFSPGESKVALATFTVKPAGIACSGELWLALNGSKVATSGEVPFVSTGVDQSISLPVTMPGAEGTYPVYLDVFVAGQLIGAYQAVEDVVITTPIVPWSFSNVNCWLSASGVGTWRQVNFSATVTNVGNARVTKTVTQYRRDYRLMWSDETMSWYREWSSPIAVKSVTINLSPGASYNYTSPEKNLIADKEPAECWLEDSDGYKSAPCTVTAYY